MGVPHGRISILLVEDDHFKRELVEQALLDLRPNAALTIGRSVQQAVRMLQGKSYDVIILDISLPSHESHPGGAQPISQPSGGVEVLLELSYEKRHDRVLIVTQYPDIEFNGRLYPLARFPQAIASSVSVRILDVIYFNAQDKVWRDKLRKAFDETS